MAYVGNLSVSLGTAKTIRSASLASKQAKYCEFAKLEGWAKPLIADVPCAKVALDPRDTIVQSVTLGELNSR